MKKPLAFLLAMVMTLSLAACGGNNTKESSSDKTSSNAEQSDTVKDTEQAPQGKVDVTDSLVGTWYLLPKGFNNALIEYNEDFPTDLQPNLSSSSSSTNTGTGTTDDIVYVSFDEAVKEIAIAKDGKITVNGTEYSMTSSSGETYDRSSDTYGEFKESFTVEIGEDKYRIYESTSSDNSEYVVFEPIENKKADYTPVYSNKHYTEKTAELTMDNWQDFFEFDFVPCYGLSKDEWGDVQGVMGRLRLWHKNKALISEIQNGRIAFKSAITETATIHFNKNEEDKYTFSDEVAESNESSDGETELYSTNQRYYSDSIGVPKDFKDAGSEYTQRVPFKASIEITRIMGTITYLTAE